MNTDKAMSSVPKINTKIINIHDLERHHKLRTAQILWLDLVEPASGS